MRSAGEISRCVGAPRNGRVAGGGPLITEVPVLRWLRERERRLEQRQDSLMLVGKCERAGKFSDSGALELEPTCNQRNEGMKMKQMSLFPF